MRTKFCCSVIALACTLCLCGCAIRMTGPCLGFGCPIGSGSAGTNAMMAAPRLANASSTAADTNATAQNGSAATPDATPKKKHHRFLFVF
ncbi:MAG TPA: hypothetical protein VMH00_16460 [Candidatus Limnocylindrales bacterium]|nr:hypothetical protein [Candidatus Limnocylindrales bacterium]